MIVTMEHIDILDRAERLSEKILQSEVMHRYKEAHHRLYNDKTASELVHSFTSIKERYEEVERFGRYHPSYAEIMREVRAIKRKMDMHPYVAEFKLRERELQGFLDDISEVIANSVSDQILVPREDGLNGGQHCTTGNCGTGKACACSVS